MTPDEARAIIELAAKATGDWNDWRLAALRGQRVAGEFSADDAAYIAAVDPQTVLALLAALDRAEAVATALRDEWDELDGWADEWVAEKVAAIEAQARDAALAEAAAAVEDLPWTTVSEVPRLMGQYLDRDDALAAIAALRSGGAG